MTTLRRLHSYELRDDDDDHRYLRIKNNNSSKHRHQIKTSSAAKKLRNDYTPPTPLIKVVPSSNYHNYFSLPPPTCGFFMVNNKSLIFSIILIAAITTNVSMILVTSYFHIGFDQNSHNTDDTADDGSRGNTVIRSKMKFSLQSNNKKENENIKEYEKDMLQLIPDDDIIKPFIPLGQYAMAIDNICHGRQHRQWNKNTTTSDSSSSSSNISHNNSANNWCLCDDHLKHVYMPRRWRAKHEKNKEIISSSLERLQERRRRRQIQQQQRQQELLRKQPLSSSSSSSSFENIDVVFYGDSIIWGWSGGVMDKVNFPHLKKVFDGFFHKEKEEEDEEGANDESGGDGGGAKPLWEGLGLGITGCITRSLLWRLQNGELPPNLNPKVFWILIGTNDLTKGCSAAETFYGILRIVEEIRRRKPSATIVLNGILPTSVRRDGRLSRPSSIEEMTTYAAATVEKVYKWPSIVAINRWLKEFCEWSGDENLSYFDARDIFTSRRRRQEEETTTGMTKETDDDDDGDEWVIPKVLMDDYLHPTELGYRVWGQSIVDWLEERRLRLFSPPS